MPSPINFIHSLMMLKKTVRAIFRFFGYELLALKKNRYENDPGYLTYQKLLDVPGFFSFPAFKLFSHLERMSEKNTENKNLPVLEIGVYCGMSLLGLCLIYRDQKIIGVDPFFETFEDSTFNEESVFLQRKANNMGGQARIDNLLEKSKALKIRDRMEIKKMTQEDFLKHAILEKNQLVYVDGEHTFQSIIAFLDKISALLEPNGFLVMDDFLSPGFPGVTEAVYTHETYKKTLFPVCYAFNKAVFVYQPAEKYFTAAREETKLFADDNMWKSHTDENGALIIHE